MDLYHAFALSWSWKMSKWNMKVVPILKPVFIVMLLTLYVVPADAALCGNRRCFNSGTLLLGQSIFNRCRCECPPNYFGLSCQYTVARKRSLDNFYEIMRRLQSISDAQRHRTRR